MEAPEFSTSCSTITPMVYTNEQLDAIRANPEVPLAIIAAAGSGKTSILCARIAYLLGQGVQAKSILPLTFTQAAARELRERVASMRRGRERVGAWTFHSFCLRIIRQNRQLLKLENISVCSQSQQRTAVNKLLNEYDAQRGKTAAKGDNHPQLKEMQNWLNKTRLSKPGKYAGEYQYVLTQYEVMLNKEHKIDFADMINLTLKLWEESPEVLEQHRGQYRYILVDEFQDTNCKQLELVLKLLGHESGRLTVVGDDDQCIFGFQGSEPRYIKELEQHFPPSRCPQSKHLSQNFRCTQRITEAAASLIQHNEARVEKEIKSTNLLGDPVQVVQCRDEFDEALAITRKILILRASAVSAADVAVLYRSQFVVKAVKKQFQEAGIPFFVMGEKSLGEREEVRDVLAYLTLAVNPDDDGAFMRVLNKPTRGLGPKAELHIKQARQEGESYHSACERINAGSKENGGGNGEAEQPKYSGSKKKVMTSKKGGGGGGGGAAWRKSLGRFMSLVQGLRDCAGRGGPEGLQAAITYILDGINYRQHLYKLDQRLNKENEKKKKKAKEKAEEKDTDIDEKEEAETKEKKEVMKEGEIAHDEGRAKEQNVSELVALARSFQSPESSTDHIRDFIESISPDKDNDDSSASEQQRLKTRKAVALMTIHKAKGLEWPIDVLPSHKSGDAGIEEERRLLYVAMTRAKKELFMTFIDANERQQSVHPSRFIGEIKPACLTKTVSFAIHGEFSERKLHPLWPTPPAKWKLPAPPLTTSPTATSTSTSTSTSTGGSGASPDKKRSLTNMKQKADEQEEQEEEGSPTKKSKRASPKTKQQQPEEGKPPRRQTSLLNFWK